MCLEKRFPQQQWNKKRKNKYQAWKTCHTNLLFVRIPLRCSVLSKNLGSKLYLSCVHWRTASRWENVSIKHLRTLEFELITMSLHWNVLSHEYVYKSMSFRRWTWTWMKMSQLVYCAGTQHTQIHNIQNTDKYMLLIPERFGCNGRLSIWIIKAISDIRAQIKYFL